MSGKLMCRLMANAVFYPVHKIIYIIIFIYFRLLWAFLEHAASDIVFFIQSRVLWRAQQEIDFKFIFGFSQEM